MSGVFWYLGSTKAQMLASPMAASTTAEGSADIAEALARDCLAGRDAPLGGEEPDAVGEVPADGDHRDDVDGEHPGIGEFVLHFGEGRAGIFREADAHETLTQDVLDDVERRR